jgi:hypothetical protein
MPLPAYLPGRNQYAPIQAPPFSPDCIHRSRGTRDWKWYVLAGCQPGGTFNFQLSTFNRDKSFRRLNVERTKADARIDFADFELRRFRLGGGVGVTIWIQFSGSCHATIIAFVHTVVNGPKGVEAQMAICATGPVLRNAHCADVAARYGRRNENPSRERD